MSREEDLGKMGFAGGSGTSDYECGWELSWGCKLRGNKACDLM